LRARPLVAVLATSIATAGAAIGFTATAQATTTLPGLNGKIAFTSDRDFFESIDSPLRGLTTCQDQTLDGACGQEIYSMNPDGSAPTRLTNNTAADDEPAWLPADGARIAFESDRASGGGCDDSECGYDIWSMVGDGSSPVQLTSDQGDETRPSYSPDGSQIAFDGLNPSLVAKPSNRLTLVGTGPSEVFTMPAAGEGGSGPTPLLPADQTGMLSDTSLAQDAFPAWSPDGSKIAFTRLLLEGLNGLAPDAPRGVTSLTIDVRTYIAPATGTGPAVPLETYPLCTITDVVTPPPAALRSAIGAVESAMSSGNARALSRALGRGFSAPACTWDFRPAWSPDGSQIVVTQESSAATNPTSTGGQRLIPEPVDFGDIASIPVANPAAEVNLSNVTEPSDCVISGPSNVCSADEDPSWSPDGTKIVFDSDRNASGTSDCEVLPDSCDGEIWTMNADGTNPVQLTNNAADDFNPDWQRIPPPPPPVPPVTPATPPKVGVAGVRRACVSSSFHVRFHIATTASSVKSVVVKLDGKRIKSTTKGSFTLTINGKKLKSGRHRLTITATDSAGHVTTTHKSFSVCKAAKPRRKAAPRFTG
jgi:Tol biopolymer transport system component